MAHTPRAPSMRPIGRVLAAAAALTVNLAMGPSTLAVARPLPAPAVRAECGTPAPGRARCHALIRTDVNRSSRPFPSASAGGATPAVAPLYPADLQAAYGLTAAAASSGAGVTVAVVDAYDDPTAESDLAAYRSSLGLPACTSASGCFTKVNQSGGTSYPRPDSGWTTEIALDLDMVSAICPNCSILLVEANSDNLSDLGRGVNRAIAMGAKFISNSYGSSEDAGERSWDAAWYTHPGVVITASSGDIGYGVQFPAASPHVVAVGGTTLSRGPGGTWSQSAWSGGGSGCSAYEPKPPWQTDSGCAKRTVADVSAVADPSTGVAVYVSGGWYLMGGTSAAAPIVAAAYALAGTPAAGTYPASYPYLRGGLTDVVGGTNGLCGAQPYLCQGVAGYDGPTGLGTTAGTTPFTAPTVPGQPLGVSGVAGSGSVAVTWSQPASDGGAAITEYAVMSSPGAKTCTWTSGPLGCTVTGLTNGASYTFTATATNLVGTSAASSPSSGVTPRTVPGQPHNVTGTPGNGLVGVTWSAPGADGGSAITGYTATASPGGATCTATPPTTSCTVGGLVNGQGYTFIVTAANAAGAGPPSSTSAAVAPRTVPGAPIGVQAQPGNGSAVVTWSAPSSDGGAVITRYTVTASPGGGTCSWSAGPLECTVSGLANGQGYTFTVVATNAAGTGPASSPSGGMTQMSLPAAAPAGVAVVPVPPTVGSLAVTWQAPDDGGSEITGYTATAFAAVTLASTGRSCAVTGMPPATGCTITGLAPGVAVVVRVAATTAAGTGLASAASDAVTPPTAPTAVVGSLPTWSLATRLVVPLFGTPGTNAVAGYDVRSRHAAWNGSFGSFGYRSTMSPSVAFTVSPGFTYCFSVRARDTLGFVSPKWSAERCTAIPLDDRNLSRRGSWSTGTGSAYYRSTWTRSTSFGATLVRTSVKAKRIAIVVTTCSTCGSVRVYWGSTLLRSISLKSSAGASRKIITVATFSSARSGTLTIKVATSGRTVLIDGLAISRT